MDFKNKIIASRATRSNSSLAKACESDRGRIINSAAIRRLQQKTQVFPLERNAAVRSRLTHSLEVQQVGRFIVQTIFEQLSESEIKQWGLDSLERPMESMVEMACLMHDIGNPPFGHFGEKAISDWFAQFLHQFGAERSDNPLLNKLCNDLENFEGNAQAIRILHSLQKFNLTYAQTASILKYTRPAYEAKPDKSSAQSYLKKKPGFYLAEQPFVEELRNSLDIADGNRFPLTYIMEAADDTSYCYADIEDAVEKNILTIPQLIELLMDEYGRDLAESPCFSLFGHSKSFKQILDSSYKRYQQEDVDKANQFFISLRVSINHILVQHAAKRFVNNIEAVYSGSFNGALLEDDSPQHRISETLKLVALKHVFSHPEVEEQELRGYQILHGLLDIYKPLLQLSCDDFTLLVNENISAARHYAREIRLLKKLPGKHIRAYKESCTNPAFTHFEKQDWELYCRGRLLQDYISGMTDQFAMDEYQTLMALN